MSRLLVSLVVVSAVVASAHTWGSAVWGTGNSAGVDWSSVAGDAAVGAIAAWLVWEFATRWHARHRAGG